MIKETKGRSGFERSRVRKEDLATEGWIKNSKGGSRGRISQGDEGTVKGADGRAKGPKNQGPKNGRRAEGLKYHGTEERVKGRREGQGADGRVRGRSEGQRSEGSWAKDSARGRRESQVGTKERQGVE